MLSVKLCRSQPRIAAIPSAGCQLRMHACLANQINRPHALMHLPAGKPRSETKPPDRERWRTNGLLLLHADEAINGGVYLGVAVPVPPPARRRQVRAGLRCPFPAGSNWKLLMVGNGTTCLAVRVGRFGVPSRTGHWTTMIHPPVNREVFYGGCCDYAANYAAGKYCRGEGPAVCAHRPHGAWFIYCCSDQRLEYNNGLSIGSRLMLILTCCRQ